MASSIVLIKAIYFTFLLEKLEVRCDLEKSKINASANKKYKLLLISEHLLIC